MNIDLTDAPWSWASDQKKPEIGDDLLLMVEDEETTIVHGMYDESGYYRLEFDKTVGCLRKQPVRNNVVAWYKPVYTIPAIGI